MAWNYLEHCKKEQLLQFFIRGKETGKASVSIVNAKADTSCYFVQPQECDSDGFETSYWEHLKHVIVTYQEPLLYFLWKEIEVTKETS